MHFLCTTAHLLPPRAALLSEEVLAALAKQLEQRRVRTEVQRSLTLVVGELNTGAVLREVGGDRGTAFLVRRAHHLGDDRDTPQVITSYTQ